MAEMIQFSNMEMNILDKFRDLFKAEVESDRKRFNDTFLLRWLMARDFNLDKAEVMLRNCLAWRLEHKIDGLRDEVFPGEYTKLYPWSVIGQDRDGRPVFHMPWGRWEAEVEDKDLVVRWIDRGLEISMRECEDSKWNSDPTKSHSQFTILVDLEGFSLQKICNKKLFEYVVDAIRHMNNYYPETVHKIFVVNVPSIFPVLWNAIRPLLPPKTLGKISMLGSNREDRRRALEEILEPHQVAAILNGDVQDLSRSFA